MTNKVEKEDIQEDSEHEFFLEVLLELDLIKDHPRLLVLVSHGLIELMVNCLIEHYMKNGKKISRDTRSYPHSVKLLMLNELGVISDSHFKLKNWFRKLRNKAAHQPLFNLSKNDLGNLHDNYRDPENFHGFCVMLLGGFWNLHIPIFGPVFSPIAYGNNEINFKEYKKLKKMIKSNPELKSFISDKKRVTIKEFGEIRDSYLRNK